MQSPVSGLRGAGPFLNKSIDPTRKYSWKKYQFHGYKHLSKLAELYNYNLYISLYISYIPIEATEYTSKAEHIGQRVGGLRGNRRCCDP